METPSMIGYIQDQGRALKATFENRAVYCNPFCQIFQERDIRKIYLLGSGTSYNAATAIKQYLEISSCGSRSDDSYSIYEPREN